MSINATGTGFKLCIIDKGGKFPNGYIIDTFSDDTDPIDSPNKEILQYANEVNGSLVWWSKASPTEITISVCQDTDGDIYLSSLFSLNEPRKGKRINDSEIYMQLIYPDGKIKFLNKGRMVDGSAVGGISSDGKKKTKTFKFVFEEVI